MISCSLIGANEPATRVPREVLMRVATFLHRELPIRLAHRIHDLDNPLFASVASMPSVARVREWYRVSLQEIVDAKPPGASPEAEHAFSKMLDRVYERHAAVLYTMAVGVYELREQRRRAAAQEGDGGGGGARHPRLFEDADEIHAFLNSFYMSRVGIRMLIGQYLALRELQVRRATRMQCNAM